MGHGFRFLLSPFLYIFLFHWNFDFSSNHSIIYFSVWISFWTVIYHQIISMFPYSDGRMFFQRFIFPAKTLWEKYSERIWVFQNFKEKKILSLPLLQINKNIPKQIHIQHKKKNK
jgi:hypothetical protein